MTPFDILIYYRALVIKCAVYNIHSIEYNFHKYFKELEVAGMSTQINAYGSSVACVVELPSSSGAASELSPALVSVPLLLGTLW